jgi:hypothetical protein
MAKFRKSFHIPRSDDWLPRIEAYLIAAVSVHMPSMCVNEQDADFLLELLDCAIDPSHKDCFGETPKPTRETHALPRTAALLDTGRELFVRDTSNFALCPRPSI